MNFVKALEGIQNGELWKRKVIKNDTVIIAYKKRLYQMSQETGIRYQYTPSNKDLFSNDWIRVE